MVDKRTRSYTGPSIDSSWGFEQHYRPPVRSPSVSRAEGRRDVQPGHQNFAERMAARSDRHQELIAHFIPQTRTERWDAKGVAPPQFEWWEPNSGTLERRGAVRKDRNVRFREPQQGEYFDEQQRSAQEYLTSLESKGSSPGFRRKPVPLSAGGMEQQASLDRAKKYFDVPSDERFSLTSIAQHGQLGVEVERPVRHRGPQRRVEIVEPNDRHYASLGEVGWF